MIRPKTDQWLADLSHTAEDSGFAIEKLGEAHGLPLLAFRKNAPAPKARRIYLSAGIHGDEPAGPLALERLLESRFFDGRFTWTICPLLNPGGWGPGTRENPDGIDLNREYRTPKAPETQSHRYWLEQSPPNNLFLSLHEDWEATGFYLYEINTSTFPSLAEPILREVERTIPREPMSRIDDHEVTAPGYIHHRPEADEPENWPEAIFHLKLYPHLSYTFETPSTLAEETRIAAQVIAVETAIEEFQKA